MKRKLVDFDTFQKIKQESFINTQKELEAAAPLLAESLDLENLTLESYTNDEVLFESLDGDFVHAKYDISNGYVKFEDVEQLVLNEESEIAESKELLSKMIDYLVENNETKAENLFSEYMDLPRTKRVISEEYKLRSVPIRKKVGGKTKIVGYRKARWNVTSKKHEKPSSTIKRMRSKKINNRKMPAGLKLFLKAKRDRVNKSIGKNMKEWSVIAENVLNFVDLQTNGPEVNNIKTLRREGEVVAVKVPTIALRNEARVLKFDWKTMNTDVVIKRNNAKKLHENKNFIKTVSELRHLNAISNTSEFEAKMENAVINFSDVLYLTESELKNIMANALENSGSKNFDDETCSFLAEGLLRTAHDTFVDRVAKIVRQSGGRLNERAEDKYANFCVIANDFYSKLDESALLEMQAFVDVYEALRQVHKLAKEEGNESVANETASYLDDLLPIISGVEQQNLDVLNDSAEWLDTVVEATSDEMSADPVVNYCGEHPDLAKKAKMSQSPSEMQGSTPDFQPTSSGKGADASDAKELGDEGWGNIGGDGVYPELDNPYCLKSDARKIVGEKDIDSDSDQLAHWGDDDTWPNLKNTYSKDSVTPKSVKE